MAASAEIWSCQKCTFNNALDHLQCAICHAVKPTIELSESYPSTQSNTNNYNTNNYNTNNLNDKSEQEDDDDEDEELIDLTNFDDSKNKNNNAQNNNNNQIEKPSLKSYPTEEISQTSNPPDVEQYNDDNNYNDNNGYDNGYDNDSENDLEYQNDLAYQINQSLLSNGNNNRNNNSNNNFSNEYDSNDSDINIINSNENNNRKRKRNIKNDLQSPAKKRKIDEEPKPKPKRKRKKKKQNNDINELDNTFCENMNFNNNNNFVSPYESIDASILSKKDRNQIEKGYQKFLKQLMKGAYALYTVCIEYGPNFCGRSNAFINMLSDTQWRPKGLLLPQNTPFEHSNNNNLLEFICRFKHYKLETNKNLIFAGSNNENEIAKLSGLKINGLGEYFLPRLINKNDCVYSSYVLIRLNWSNFKRLWNSKQFIPLIQKVKQIENVGIINICLEGVIQQINKIENANHQTGNNNTNGTEFKCEKDLKNRMTSYYFSDKTLHFTYTNKPSETAENIVRIARSIADHRFKKIRVNQLSISDHNMKGIRADKNKTTKDILFSTLIGIHNLSEKQAGGIIARYPSVKSLMNAYEAKSEPQGELLLADLTANQSNRRIGPAISKRVYNVFYKNMDGDKLMNS